MRSLADVQLVTPGAHLAKCLRLAAATEVRIYKVRRTVSSVLTWHRNSSSVIVLSLITVR